MQLHCNRAEIDSGSRQKSCRVLLHNQGKATVKLQMFAEQGRYMELLDKETAKKLFDSLPQTARRHQEQAGDGLTSA